MSKNTTTTAKGAAMVLAKRLATYSKQGINPSQVVAELLKLLPQAGTQFDITSKTVAKGKKKNLKIVELPKKRGRPAKDAGTITAKKTRGRPKKQRTAEELAKIAADEQKRNERRISREKRKSEESIVTKKPPNSYMTWFQDLRPNILKDMERDGIPKQDLRRVAGQIWKAMSDNKKEPWVTRANQRLEEWKVAQTLLSFSN